MSYVNHADLGGQPGHGAVVPEPEGELFHAAWEPRVLALSLAMGATRAWNLDMSRAARETLPDYASLSYYEIWLAGLQRLLQQRGMLDGAELASARALLPRVAVPRVLAAAEVAAVLAAGAPTARATAVAPRRQVGDRVRTTSGIPNHHTPLPGYVRDKCGVIERLHGAHVFADAHAQGLGEQPQWLYTAVFAATGPVAGSRRPSHGVGRRLGTLSGGGMTARPGSPTWPGGDNDEPVFSEPWQAQAFAMVLRSHEHGLFSGSEWAGALAAQIAAAPTCGEADSGIGYYRHWLSALEFIVAAKGASSAAELDRYRHAWDHAADRTPHGQPIELQPRDFEQEG